MGDNDTDPRRMRRRVIIDDDDPEVFENADADNDSIGSNPDELLNDGQEVEDDAEGEDLEETWLEDYAPAPELDSYDATMLADDEDIDETYEEQMRYRRDAERELDIQLARRKINSFLFLGAIGIISEDAVL